MASANRITLALTEKQLAFLQQLADDETEQQGRRVSTAAVVRQVLADHFGDRWPDPDRNLTWGGFDEKARIARWRDGRSDNDQSDAASDS